MDYDNRIVEYDAFDLRSIDEYELSSRAERLIWETSIAEYIREQYPESSELFSLVVERFRNDPVTARRMGRLTLWWINYAYFRDKEPEEIVRQADLRTALILGSPPCSGK